MLEHVCYAHQVTLEENKKEKLRMFRIDISENMSAQYIDYMYVYVYVYIYICVCIYIYIYI